MTTLAHLLKSVDFLDVDLLSPAALDATVTSVTADSRQVQAGSLFVAVAGATNDGRLFIPDAVARGCLAVIVEGETVGNDLPVPVIRVEDSHAAIGDLAAAWYGHPAKRMVMIGVTGTNGKTTCTWLIEAMVAAAGGRPGVIGTVNYRYHAEEGIHVLCDAPLTTPDPLTLQGTLRIMADKGVTHVIMEVSSHALHQRRLGRTCFDAALFTNLSRDHLDYHRTMDDYFAAKERLFRHHLKPDGAAVVVIGPRAEGVDWGAAISRTVTSTRLFRCGLGDSGFEAGAEAVVQSVEGFRCRLNLQGDKADFASPLTGGYNVLNVLAAAGVGLALGLPADRIRSGLAGVSRVPGRLERVRLAGETPGTGPAVFVDYAHTPDALENVLATLRSLATGRLICVFGCGGDRDRGKRPQMGAMAGRHADVVIVTSDNPRTEEPEAIIEAIVPGVTASGKQCYGLDELFCGPQPANGFGVIVDRRQAIVAACSLAAPGDSILIAGKGHEPYQIVGTEKHFFDDRMEAIDGLLQWNERSLLAATGGRVAAGALRRVVRRISTDSRSLEDGDVFVALAGETFDGHRYIDTALDAGAAAVIVEKLPATCRDGVLYLQVEDTLRALGGLAGHRRRLLDGAVKIAAVTGSSGKTTVKEMVAAIFAEALGEGRTSTEQLLKTQGNFNNLVGLPLTLLPLAAGHRLAIVEMGMNVPGEIARLTEIADPDIGCINNVHPAHLQGLGTIAGVAAAKGELFFGMRPEAVRVVNCDDPHVLDQARRAGGTQIGFAVTAAGRRHRPLVRVTRPVNLGDRGMRFTLHIGDWQRRLTVPVYGMHNVSNCAAAAAIAHAALIGSEVIVRALAHYTPSVDKRLAVSQLPGGLKVVNDAYNANPASMAAGLRTVAGFGAGCRRIAALGDMLELGDASPALHADIGSLVARLGFDHLLVTGAQAEQVAGAAMAAGMRPENVHVLSDPPAMADPICRMLAEGGLGQGDWLLIKGSRGMRMERLLEELEHRLQTAQI